MQCPKCEFEQPDRATECARCGVVFARLSGPRTPPPVSDASFDATDLSPEGRRALAIGAVIAVVVFALPFTRFVFSYLGILVHELGHAVAGWGFGYASIPAFDFSYGGGVTIHSDDRSWFVLLLVYGAFGFLIHAFRRNPLTRNVVIGVVAVYTILAATPGHEVVQIAMGHAFELLFAGIFLYRACSGNAIKHAVERPLYAACGFFIVLNDLVFAYGLLTNESKRRDYEDAKGGGHWMDFSRLAEDYFGIDLQTVAFQFLIATIATPLLAWLAHRNRDKVDHWRSRLLRLEA